MREGRRKEYHLRSIREAYLEFNTSSSAKLSIPSGWQVMPELQLASQYQISSHSLSKVLGFIRREKILTQVGSLWCPISYGIHGVYAGYWLMGECWVKQIESMENSRE